MQIQKNLEGTGYAKTQQLFKLSFLKSFNTFSIYFLKVLKVLKVYYAYYSSIKY